MTADQLDDDVLAAVVIALDEEEVPIWFEHWRNSPGPLRQRMDTEILLAAVVRNHNDPRLRREIRQFRALVDADQHLPPWPQ